MTGLYRPAGSLAVDGWSVVLTPEDAGWAFSGLRAGTLHRAGASLRAGADEVVVLPLEGGFDVVVDGELYRLVGRRERVGWPDRFRLRPARIERSSVQQRRRAVRRRDGPWRAALSRAPRARVGGLGRAARRGCVLPGGPQLRGRRSVRGGPADRGRGVVARAATGAPIRPTSTTRCATDETDLEEIYHYVVADGPSGPGLAYQHIYGTPDRPIDLLTTVRTGDVVLVPHGWHGPAMAAPGYDLYYLNVMAGPGERAWRACDDPAHAWVRDAWAGQAVDPRLPFGRGGSGS